MKVCFVFMLVATLTGCHAPEHDAVDCDPAPETTPADVLRVQDLQIIDDVRNIRIDVEKHSWGTGFSSLLLDGFPGAHALGRSYQIKSLKSEIADRVAEDIANAQGGHSSVSKNDKLICKIFAQSGTTVDQSLSQRDFDSASWDTENRFYRKFVRDGGDPHQPQL